MQVRPPSQTCDDQPAGVMGAPDKLLAIATPPYQQALSASSSPRAPRQRHHEDCDARSADRPCDHTAVGLSDHLAHCFHTATGGRIDNGHDLTVTAVPIAISSRSPHADIPERPVPGEMPTHGPLVDRYGRVHDDLRLSVTDRCNLRCVYCMPTEGMPFLPRSEVLSLEEIVRVAGVARSLGVSSVRVTGGEPLVRRGIVDLVSRLTDLGFSDVALTTNGILLADVAPQLAAAGLRRVNVSCDSLRPERFASIRRRGTLDVVLAAMDAAEAAGLAPLKVNVVLLRGDNDDEILDFAAWARHTGRVVRFIEYMPLDAQGAWDRTRLVPGREVLERIAARWPIEAVPEPDLPAPADRFRFADGSGEIGVISTVTQPFCGTCNRLRLTADGAIRNCLFSDDERSVRDLLRGDGTDDDLALELRRAVWGKLPGHGINEPGFLRPARSMSMIGG
jgi:GTP 3',8-cyclase